MRDIRVTQYARAQEAQDMPEENKEHAQHVCQTHTMHVEHHGTTRADMSCRADMESGAVAGEELRHSMHSERGSVVELGPVLHMAASVGVRYSAASARWDEANLLRAMEQLRVSTREWRYGKRMTGAPGQ